MLAAVCLQTRQESWSYPEAAAGALFLVVGAVFPLHVLPAMAQAAGLLTPGIEIAAALLVTSALVTLVAATVFRLSERRAKDRGLIDRTSGS